MYKKLSFIIPIYNEEKTLEELIQKVLDVEMPLKKELVLVDDGSKDSSRDILKNYEGKDGFKVVYNEKNMGKSQTVRNGIQHSTGDLVVIQDADFEYEPQNLKEFVKIFMEDKADLVYGNRFGKKNEVIYAQNWIGNTMLSYFSSIFTGLRGGMWTRDMEVCYKMCKGEVFREIGATIQSKSTFGLEPEMTAKFAKYRLNGKRLRFKQVPIDYYPRSIAEGKKMNAFKDGAKALWEILKFNLR
jgi:glycosyltransferase involved in cell wall biosynthesis